MKRARYEFFWALLLPLLCPWSAGAQNYPPTIGDAVVETFKTVDRTDLNVWIFFPDGHTPADSRPAMVFFFGGGWLQGSPAQFQRQARELRSHGMVTVLADYRVLNRHGSRASSGVEDAKSAIRWVRSHARDLGIDPNRIGAAGGSSGGHLAAATATLPRFDNLDEDLSVSSKPNALVLFNPVVIVAPVDGVWDTPDEMRERMDGPLTDLSPFHHVQDDVPPTLVVHGTADERVPFPTVVAYCERVAEVGGQCEVVPYEGAGHGFFNGDPYYEPTLQQALRFLSSIGWIQH